MLKKFFGVLLIFFGLFLIWRILNLFWLEEGDLLSPRLFVRQKEDDLDSAVLVLEKYSFENLREQDFIPGRVKIGQLLEETEEEAGYQFFYEADGKTISGRLDVPRRTGVFPVVVMLRGYADKEGYFSGSGTHRVASEFAKNGYLTLAPDFLGFASSSEESDDILLNRFRRPETTLYLLASLEKINEALVSAGIGDHQLDPEKVFIWGHSNGGQIALSVLEISGWSIPTTLWAPVGKGFPESVLQFASELDDNGKLVIERINRFERNYDASKYSIASYWSWIKAPIQLQQGGWDESVLPEATRALREDLMAAGVGVSYQFYPQADHNLKQAWDQAVAADLEFFGQY